MKKLITILILALFTSCSIPSLFNPDSYGKKFDNTFVFFNSQMENLYVSSYGVLDDQAYAIPNDVDYLVEWSVNADGIKTVKITLVDDIYDAAFIDEGWEMERIKNGFEVTEDKLEPVNGFSRIMLSNDLTD